MLAETERKASHEYSAQIAKIKEAIGSFKTATFGNSVEKLVLRYEDEQNTPPFNLKGRPVRMDHEIETEAQGYKIKLCEAYLLDDEGVYMYACDAASDFLWRTTANSIFFPSPNPIEDRTEIYLRENSEKKTALEQRAFAVFERMSKPQNTPQS